MYGTKVKKDIVLLYAYSNNAVEFFILHTCNINIGTYWGVVGWCDGAG